MRVVAWCLLLTVAVFAQEGAVETGAQSVNQVTEVPAVWKRDQHLYQKGVIGLSAEKAAELEEWLDQNAKNWTVVVAESVQDERYAGQRGLDAVEACLERELLGQTAFGEWKHEKTGELNGAFFVISIRERQFSYFGSEAYERRRLGGDRFANGLDGAAIRAMRNGGRIADAVRDTITLIDRRLEARIAEEGRAREASQVARKKKVSEMQRRLSEVKKNRRDFEVELSEFRKSYPDLTGDIVEDDSELWNESRAEIEGLLEGGKLNLAESRMKSLSQKTYQRGEWLQGYPPAEPMIAELREGLNSFEVHPSIPDGLLLKENLLKRLNSAEGHYREGASVYEKELLDVYERFPQLEARNEEAEAQLLREQEYEAQSRRERKAITGAVGGGAGALLLTLGAMGNRRRRGAKETAEALLAKRRAEMAEVSDELVELMGWAGLVVGTEDKLEERGYRGETLQVSRQGLSAIDRAFVISSYVQEAIDKGAKLIEPGNPVEGTRNLISGSAYREAIDLLDSEVSGSAATPPPLPVKEGEKKMERLSSLVDEQIVQELPQWQRRLQETMEEGRVALQRVDEAWTTIVDRREGLEAAIIHLEHLEGKVDDWESDGWLQLDALFESWIPEMQRLLDAGGELAQGDPVAALDGPLSEGERMADEARALIAGVVDFREQCWDGVKKNENTLVRLGRHSAWLGGKMDEFTEESEELCHRGRGQSVAEEVARFSEALISFAEQVAETAEQAERAEKEVKVSLESASSRVRQARASLGQRLGVSAEGVLVEEERNPDLYLEEGNLQRSAALAAIDNGEATAAEEFLDQADGLVAEALQLVEDSEEIFRSFDQSHRQLTGLHEKAGAHSEEVSRLVEGLRNNFAASALFVNLEEKNGESYRNAPVRLKSRSDEVVRALQEARESFESARLLAAQDFLDSAAAGIEGREALCGEVEARQKELEELEVENDLNLEKEERTTEDLRETVADRRVMASTVSLFVEAEANLELAQEAVGAKGVSNDPYRAESLLAELSERLLVVKTEAGNDVVLYDQGLLLQKQANAAKAMAEGLVRDAQNDGVTDSRELQSAIGRVESAISQLGRTSVLLEEAHGDWRAVGDELTQVRSALTEANLVIRRELKFAREAMTRISQAEGAMRQAAQWSGRYGVRVQGAPGYHAVEAANRAVLNGEYQDCIRHAGFAIAQARKAIAAAEAEEARRRRRAEAAARARRQAARRSRMSSSSMGSSRRSMGSRSSSRSRVGRSSMGSRSRVGRSGW